MYHLQGHIHNNSNKTFNIFNFKKRAKGVKLSIGRFNIPVLKLMLRTILFKIKKHKSDNPLVNIQFSLKQNVHLGNNQQCMNENK